MTIPEPIPPAPAPPLSPRGVDALTQIARLADRFRSGRITSARFVARVGQILSELERSTS